MTIGCVNTVQPKKLCAIYNDATEKILCAQTQISKHSERRALHEGDIHPHSAMTTCTERALIHTKHRQIIFMYMCVCVCAHIHMESKRIMRSSHTY